MEGGSDADVLVRPSQVRRFVRVLEGAGWQRRSRFHTGSPFGHAQTYWHDHLGYADVHRFFPGLGQGDDTFEAGIPESFNVLVKELQALGLNVELEQAGDD